MTIEIARPAMRLDVYSHGVKVTGFDDRGKSALLSYCMHRLGQKGLVKYAPGKFKKEVVKIFAGGTADRNEFRFHRNVMEDLIAHLEHWKISRHRLEIYEHSLYTPAPANFIQKDMRPLRDIQIPQVNYMMEPGTIKVTTLQTGRGKSRIFLQSVLQHQQRVVLVIQAKYITKWIEDAEAFFHLKKGDLMVVQGGKDMMSLMALAVEGELKASFIIISNKTMYDYLKTYNTMQKESPYPILPEDFYKTLGVGIRGIDEVHQDYHLNFKQDVYTHVPKTISMSATLEPDDHFLMLMYDINFPRGLRAPTVAYNKYIRLINLWYSIDRYSLERFIRFKDAKKQYSHTEFEKSLMRRPQLLKPYVKMIVDHIDMLYVEEREPGQSCLLFCSTVKMCGIVRDALREKFPTLVINRYTSEEPLSYLQEADICVTTLQSAGTAIDKPNLKVGLLTTALSSKVANEQVIGRLRELKDWPDVKPEFYFFSAYEISKHVEYAAAKRDKMDGKVLSYQEIHTRYRI